MRTFALFLLLASTTMPAVAQRGDDDDRRTARASRAEASDDRPQRAQRIERRESGERPQRQFQIERRQVEQQQSPSARGERLLRYQQRQVEQQQVQGDSPAGQRLERYRQRQLEAGQQVQGGGGLVQRQSRIRTIPTTAPEIGQQGPVRQDVRIGTRHNRYDRNRWSSHWRNDHRYNWRRYRDRNRSIFRIGFYYDPFGYGYSRFGIGSYLYPNYYRSSYWISDPWQYRLPPAYGPYRWIRYHNDAVLIDTWTGEVVDVIYGFFW